MPLQGNNKHSDQTNDRNRHRPQRRNRKTSSRIRCGAPTRGRLSSRPIFIPTSRSRIRRRTRPIRSPQLLPRQRPQKHFQSIQLLSQPEIPIILPLRFVPATPAPRTVLATSTLCGSGFGGVVEDRLDSHIHGASGRAVRCVVDIHRQSCCARQAACENRLESQLVDVAIIARFASRFLQNITRVPRERLVCVREQGEGEAVPEAGRRL